MEEYTCSQARQRLSTVLEKACDDGAVRIKSRDGKVLVVRPEPESRSPLDVGGLDLKIDRSEILELILGARRRGWALVGAETRPH